MTKEDIPSFCPANRQAWRMWLEENHEKEKSVWLVFHKSKSNIPTITWSEAVDEALCFGWIDSIAKPLDEEKFMRFFSKRKAGSVWSTINKDKIQRLIAEDLMMPAGLESIETAKQNGCWTILDTVETLTIPLDLEEEFKKKENAKSHFLSWSKSDRKSILQWLVQAKRQETRQNRVVEIAELAEQNMKPKVVKWIKK